MKRCDSVICENIQAKQYQKKALLKFSNKAQCIDDSVQEDLERAGDYFSQEFEKSDECVHVFSSHRNVCYDQAIRVLHLKADPEGKVLLENLALYHIKIILLRNKIDWFQNSITFYNSYNDNKMLFTPVTEVIKQVTRDTKGLKDNCEDFIERDKERFFTFFYSMNQLLGPEPKIRESIRNKLRPRIDSLKQLIEDFIKTFLTTQLDQEIEKILRRFISWWSEEILILEWPFFSIEKTYRDHTYHSLRTAYLGNTLLNLYIPPLSDMQEPEWFIKYLANRTSFEKDEIRWGWFICAILHDIGLIICKSHPSRHEYLNKCFEPYNFFFRWDDADKEKWVLLKVKKQVIELLKKSLHCYPKIKSKTMLLEFNESQREIRVNRDFHGLVGASLILSLLPDNCNYTSSLENILLEITGAVAFHDLDIDKCGIKSIKLSEHPLGFLLKLCDEAQEWGRPILHRPEIPHNTPLWREIFLRLLYKPNLPSHPFMMPKDSLTFLIDYTVPENLYYFKILELFWDWNKVFSSREKNLHTLYNDLSCEEGLLLPKFKFIYNWPANEVKTEDISPDKLRSESLEIQI